MNHNRQSRGEAPRQTPYTEINRRLYPNARHVGGPALHGAGVPYPSRVPITEQITQPIRQRPVEHTTPPVRRQEHIRHVPERLVTTIETATFAKEGRKDPNHNEDSYFANKETQAGGVFDGAGGHAGSDLAARAAAESVNAYTSQSFGPQPVKVARGIMRGAMMQAHQDVIRDVAEIEGQEHQPTTTGTFMKVFEDSKGRQYAVTASVGDSRAYLYRQGRLTMLTIDQSFGAELAESKEEKIAQQYRLSNVTRRDQILPQDGPGWTLRNQITGSLGPGGGFKDVDINHVYLEPDDQILITSDGIHDNLTTTDIEALLRDGARAEDLAYIARQRSRHHGVDMRAKPDDMTAVSMKFIRTGR